MLLLTTREVAQKLGYSSRHVCRLVNEQKLKPFAKLQNAQNVFLPEAVEAFKEAKQRKEGNHAK